VVALFFSVWLDEGSDGTAYKGCPVNELIAAIVCEGFGCELIGSTGAGYELTISW